MPEKKTTPEFDPATLSDGQPSEIEKTLLSIAADLQDLTSRVAATEKAQVAQKDEKATPLPGTPKGAKERLEKLEEAMMEMFFLVERGAGTNDVQAARKKFAGQ